ncbi:FAD/NAD(P)-binding protein [Citrobacter braakii]|nr:FAD/NAD(P)-binding protein [Citrobacter braakii]
MRKTTVAIIGMGPRGLSILERICAQHAQRKQNEHINIVIVDKNAMGVGAHSLSQPDHLLVNTVACQITLFGDATVKNAGSFRSGPCFHQWANEQGYKNVDDRYLKDVAGKPIDANDYLPRRLLGEYLNWFYHEIIKSLPDNISVTQINQQANNILIQDDAKSIIVLEDSQRVVADYVYLTTGHSDNAKTFDDHLVERFIANNYKKNERLDYYSTPYPINNLNKITAESNVIVQGIGLTAYDVISQLTIGRGGKFSREEGELRYHPSGKEPGIFIYSRKALPFSSRGANQKGVSGQYSPRFLTAMAIRELRLKNVFEKGSSKIDFLEQVFPLLHKEMCYAYRSTLNGQWLDAGSYEPSAEDIAVIDSVLYPHQSQEHLSLKDYTQWFMYFLRKDLQESDEGNVHGPIKAATDIIRDVRDILREAIDNSGLESRSHQYFLEHFNPIFNRIAVGPPKLRNEQLLALMEANVVSLAGGKDSRLVLNDCEGKFEVHSPFKEESTEIQADVLIKAKIASFSPLHDASPLIRNMTANGIVRPFMNEGYHPGGLDIDQCQHPINRMGEAQTAFWVLGNPAEGANFYTYVLPRPLVNSRFLVDAGRCVADMYHQMMVRQAQPEVAINAD